MTAPSHYAVDETLVVPGPSVEVLRHARRRRRRRLVAWSLIPALIVLGGAGVVGHRTWATWRGIDAVEHSAFRPSRARMGVEWFDRAAWVNLYDTADPSFNRGVAWFAAGELARARIEFEDAISMAGGAQRCVVLVNLGLTMEAEAAAASEIDEASGQALYAAAKDVVVGNPSCLARTAPDGDGPGDRLARLLARLEEHLPLPTRDIEVTRADPNATGEPDDAFDQLNRRLDDNAQTRSQGRELEEVAVVPRTEHDGPRW
jgi:hypothetical protein